MSDSNSTLLLASAGIGEVSGGYRYVAGGGGGGTWSGLSSVESGLGTFSGTGSRPRGSGNGNSTPPIPCSDNMGAGGSASTAQGNVQPWPVETTGGSGVVIIKYAI